MGSELGTFTPMTQLTRPRNVAALALIMLALAACSSSTSSNNTSKPTSNTAVSTSTSAAGAPTKFVADIWGDNWFALYVNGKLVGEDSVPITTQRSFNKERITFTATYPLTVAVLAKDYIEDSSGLEYIGTPQQQIGDGGVIAQISDEATGRVVAATNAKWRTLVVQRAPLNPSCVTSANPITDCEHESIATPTEWAAPSFADASWPNVNVYTAVQVGARGDYTMVTWDPSASLIWGSDLKLDNVLLMRSPTIARP